MKPGIRIRLMTFMILSLGLLGFFILTSYCDAFPAPLKTVASNPLELKGTFTLILYGGNYLDDLETIAILDSEGDAYVLKPYAPDFDYRVQKGLQAEEALEIASKFVSFHPAFRRSQLSKILDGRGNTIGYELRPLYMPSVFGMVGDVLDVYYWLKEGGRVKITIRLVPSLERHKIPGGDGASGGGGGN